MIPGKRDRLGRVVVLVCFATLAVLPSSLSAPAPPTTKHCVWRVTNVPVPFYLVGSIHNLRGEDYPLANVYRKALKDSERLLFEYNPKEREAYAEKFRAAAKYPKGDDIRAHITPETLRLLMKNLSATRLHFDDVKQYKPWALAFRLWMRRGYLKAAGTRSVDEYLSYQAQRLRKEVGGLETVQEHVVFWENIDGERLLLYTMIRGKRLTDLYDETRAAWKRGDVAALAATNARLRDANPRIAQRLFDRRHRKWLPRIEAELRTGKPTAIVAGAGHFCGPHSVIDLLEKRGYKIEQL